MTITAYCARLNTSETDNSAQYLFTLNLTDHPLSDFKSKSSYNYGFANPSVLKDHSWE